MTSHTAALVGALSLVVCAQAVGAQRSPREADARAPIDAFFKAFNARDNEALRRTLHYPHVRINEAGGVNIWRDASEAGTNFEALTRTEGWARTRLRCGRTIR